MLISSLMICSLLLCLNCAWIIIYKLHHFNKELSYILEFILIILALLLFSNYYDSKNIEDLREEIKKMNIIEQKGGLKMNIIEAFKTAKEGSFIKHPNLHNIIYARKFITGSIVLYEMDTYVPLDLIITEEILDGWEKVTCKDLIEDVKNNNI